MASNRAGIFASTNEYTFIRENGFQSVSASPLSTFAADVDTSSYAHFRRLVMNGEPVPKDAIRIAVLGSSDDAKIGSGVIVIGNAGGYGQSVTSGIISAKDRELSIDGRTMKLLQTDSSINPGNCIISFIYILHAGKQNDDCKWQNIPGSEYDKGKK